MAAEHKKSEALVARIMSAAVQRARNLDSMNQGLAEQLQRARSDIAQVICQCVAAHARCHARHQLVHERNGHAHGRRAADDKVPVLACSPLATATSLLEIRLLTWSCCYRAQVLLSAAQVRRRAVDVNLHMMMWER